MRAVWLILTAGFRRQWKSWLLLTVLIAVASGFVLASTAAGSRWPRCCRRWPRWARRGWPNPRRGCRLTLACSAWARW
jgi:hypothetical protein